VALSLFGDFVIVYNELKNGFMGRQEPDFGGINCEFAGISPLASTSVEQLSQLFLKTWSNGINDFFFTSAI